MAQILQFLSPSLDRVVLDRTGLAGNFDLDLQWDSRSATWTPSR